MDQQVSFLRLIIEKQTNKKSLTIYIVIYFWIKY